MYGRRDAWRPPHRMAPIRPIRQVPIPPLPPRPPLPPVEALRRHRHHHLHRARMVRRVPIPLIVVLGVAAMTGVLTVITLVLSVALVAGLVAVPVLAVVGATRLAARSRGRTALATGPGGRSLAAGPAVDPWAQARARFAALRSEYAAYECDALAVLRLPALADVTVPSTARFVEAFAEAQALDADGPVPPQHRDRYLAAVANAWRCWQAAREAAERIRLSHLPEQERSTVERVVRLLTTARDSDNDAERHVAYGKARTELARLERTSSIRLPQPAQAALDNAYRGQLPA